VDKNAALIALAESEDARFWKIDYDQLTIAERAFLCVWELESEVNNGGFLQYYENLAGSRALEAPSALEQIGARKMAAIVRKANALFQAESPNADHEARSGQLEGISASAASRLEALDQEFFAYPDDLTDLLYAYVVANREQIAGADRIVPA
jgi:hypothetical protein